MDMVLPFERFAVVPQGTTAVSSVFPRDDHHDHPYQH